MLEQMLNSEQKPEALDSSSPNSTNTNVSGLPSTSPVISYFCPKQNLSCLSGLSTEDKLSFMDIVKRQFDKGIMVRINYT